MRKPFRVGDEVVVLNQRRWVLPPARTSIIREVHPRVIYIHGHNDPLRKDDITRRTPEAEKLGRLLDLRDKLDDEREEERHKAVQPVMEKYAKVIEPIDQDIRALWKKVHEEAR